MVSGSVVKEVLEQNEILREADLLNESAELKSMTSSVQLRQQLKSLLRKSYSFSPNSKNFM